jgi:endo-1,3(4)-beta-glucanase
MAKKTAFFTIFAIALLGAIGGFMLLRQPASIPSLIDANVLTIIPKKDASGIDTSHLAPGLVPPTNKWFTGVALQKTPKTIFPTPLGFTPDETSFTFYVPKVQPTKDTIFAAPSDPVTVTIEGATSYKVTRYDELSVDLTYQSGKNEPIATVTLAAGSPYIFFYAQTPTNIKISADGTKHVENNQAALTQDDHKAKALGFDGATLRLSEDVIQGTLPQKSYMTFYTLPGSTEDALATAAKNRIIGGTVRYAMEAKSYKTSLRYNTANQQKTFYGVLPHQASQTKNAPFSYDTIYGLQQMVYGDELTYASPVVPIRESLDLSGLSDHQKELLVQTLRRDSQLEKASPEDTYFGGKALYRNAQLLDIARQLRQDDLARRFESRLRNELTVWLTLHSGSAKRSFYYDTKIQGLVGVVPSFGSEEFNDHHFHYGYFIYAASILAKYDPEFLEQYRASVNVIIADIANYSQGEGFPLRRVFDPYFGHSWASGSAPFNDGNNQESVSEAINAWTAIAMWAGQIKAETLQIEAEWMLSNEVASAGYYWMNFDESKLPYDEEYNHSLVAVNWGGKRDYSTFFSAAPNAMLGIQLIPMNPTMTYQSAYESRIQRHINEAIVNDDYNVQFGDYILMYQSLRDRNTLEKAKSLPETVIDDANSRSYMYAWIMSQK